MAAKRKPRGAELYVAVVSHFGPSGGLIAAGTELPGNDPAVELRPQLFAPASGGQPAIDAASAAYLADIGEAQQAREERWYGPKVEDPPTQPARVVCIKSFRHKGQEVALGSIWRADHAVVQSAAAAFVAVKD